MKGERDRGQKEMNKREREIEGQKERLRERWSER